MTSLHRVDDVKLPSLQQIVTSSRQERLTVLLKCLGASQDYLTCLDSFVPRGMHLFCLAIVFWVRSAKPVVDENHVRALLLCSVKLFLLNDVTVSENRGESKDELSVHVKRTANSALQKFYKSEYFSRRNLMNVGIVHAFAQLQSCLFHSQMLNQILLCPLTSPDPAKLLNGSLFYNLCAELEKRPQPLTYFEEILGRDSPVVDLINRLFALIGRFCQPSDVKVTQSSKRKRRKKQKSCVPECEARVSDHVSDSSDLETCSERSEVAANCDVTNKFSVLFV